MTRIRTTQKSGKGATIIILLVAAIVLGVLYLKWDDLVGTRNRTAVDEEKLRLEKKIELLEKEISDLENRLGPAPAVSETYPFKEEPAIFPEQETTPTENPVESRCRQLTTAMPDFFRHLDEQDYIKAYELEGGSRKTFAKITEKLIANPPKVVREQTAFS